MHMATQRYLEIHQNSVDVTVLQLKCYLYSTPGLSEILGLEFH